MSDFIKDRLIKIVDDIIAKQTERHEIKGKEIEEIYNKKYEKKYGKFCGRLTDYCYNSYNSGKIDDFPKLFERVWGKWGTFICLGKGYPYNGLIKWQPGDKAHPDYNKVIIAGECINGVWNLYKDSYPNESETSHHYEGSTKLIRVNRYERDIRARNKCIEYYLNKDGRVKCQICGFNFGDKYGVEFNDVIHIHHLKPLSEIKKKYEVNPERDLLPVCPNCHVILHKKRDKKKDGIYTPDDVSKMLS